MCAILVSMTAEPDRRIAHPIVNLVAWLLAIAVMVAVAVAGGGRLLQVVGTLFSAPTPLAGRVAVGIGLGVMALLLLLFFGLLVTVLVRHATAHLARGRRR